MMDKKEWSQEEYLKHKKHNEAHGIQTVLVDTINVPIEGVESVLYNPYELQAYPEGTVLVFYCNTGKTTMERLEEYQKRFPDKACISLRGGRGYWRRACSVR
jgi:hypothetical protein